MKSPEVQAMEGNRQKNKHLDGAVEKIPHGRPVCPKELGKQARAIFNRVLDELVPLGVATRLDGPIVALTASSYARYLSETKKLETEDSVIWHDKKGPMRNPRLVTIDKAWDQTMRGIKELGKTPAARSRIIAAMDAPTDDEMEELTD